MTHVETGRCSRDTTMLEEVNSIVTDGIADLLFATGSSGVLGRGLNE